MTITLYNYSSSTGERLNEHDAEISPLDKQPIIMSFSTTKVPPNVTTNQRAVYRDANDEVPLLEIDGSWKVIPDFRGQVFWDSDGVEQIITEIGVDIPDGASLVKPIDDITTLRKRKWEEIKLSRDAHEFGTFFWNGHEFDADQRSQQRITLAVLRASQNINSQFEWRLTNNDLISLTAPEMIQVATALGMNTEDAFNHANSLRILIDNAETEQELEDIVW